MNNDLRSIQSQLVAVSISISKIIEGISTYYEEELRKKEALVYTKKNAIVPASKEQIDSLEKEIESRRKLLIESRKIQHELSNSMQVIENSQRELNVLQELNGLTIGTDSIAIQNVVMKTINNAEKRKISVTESVLKKLQSKRLKYTKTTYETNGLDTRTRRVEEPRIHNYNWDDTDSLSNEIKKQDNLMYSENSEIRNSQMPTPESEEYEKKAKLDKLTKLSNYEQEELEEIRADRDLSDNERKIAIKKKQTEIKKVTKSIAVLRKAYDKYYNSEKRQRRMLGALEFVRNNNDRTLTKIKSVLEKEESKVIRDLSRKQSEINTIEKELNADAYIRNFERLRDEMLVEKTQQAMLNNRTEEEKRLERLKVESEENNRRNSEASEIKRNAQEYLRRLAEENIESIDPGYQDNGKLEATANYTHEQMLEMEMARINREAENRISNIIVGNVKVVQPDVNTGTPNIEPIEKGRQR